MQPTAGGVPPILIAGLIVLVGLILLAIPYIGLLKGRRNLLLYGVFAAFLIAKMFFIVDVNPFAGTVAVHLTSFDILFTGTFGHVTLSRLVDSAIAMRLGCLTVHITDATNRYCFRRHVFRGQYGMALKAKSWPPSITRTFVSRRR